MTKLKYGLMLIVMLGMGLAEPAGGGCWKWVKQNVTQSPEPIDVSKATYDEGRKEVVILPAAGYLYPLQLWAYNGEDWYQYWEGPVDMAGTPASFIETYALYYDQILETLIMVGWIQYGFEQAGIGIFEFIPGQKFRLIADYDAPLWVPWACYDSKRRRTVMAGHVGSSGWTVEYDGNTFFVFDNPSGFVMTGGVAAYDPEIERTVYFGPNRDGYGLETLEWDGTTWTVMQTKTKPSQYINSMVYVPEMQGLMGVVSWPNVVGQSEPVEIWLYRNSSWEIVDIGNNPTPYRGSISDSFLAYDEADKQVLLGGVPGFTLIESTWKLVPAGHCRPTARP